MVNRVIKYAFVAVVLLASVWCNGQSISKEVATQIALNYDALTRVKTQGNKIDSETQKTNSSSQVSTRILSLNSIAPLYIVQQEDGWVLVSSEKAAAPILAYSSSGIFPDEKNMPNGMKWLFSFYEKAMKYAADSLSQSIINEEWIRLSSVDYDNISVIEQSTSSLPTTYMLERLADVKWGQSLNNGSEDPDYNHTYNKFCPSWNDNYPEKTILGCVAVAMGMIMWYYQWPHSASIPNSIDFFGDVSSSSHLSYYDWANMPSQIFNDTPINIVDEVAGLLRDCGFASKMLYGYDGSSSTAPKMKAALRSNFHFANPSQHNRNNYVGNWEEKLKSEIAANRPVIYGGQSADDGHMFVIYGYNSSNMFNINWGWRGSYNNAVFSLSPLAFYPDDHVVFCGLEPDYPSCDDYSLTPYRVSNSLFEIYRGGTITGNNITIPSGKNAAIYSQTEIILTGNVHIYSGATVHMAIRDLNCGNEISNASESQYVPQQQPLVNSLDHQEGGVEKFIQAGQFYIRKDGHIYNSWGILIE